MDLLNGLSFVDTKEVELLGKKITLRELNVFEEVELEEILKKSEAPDAVKVDQSQYIISLLAYAIVKIEGKEMKDVIGSDTTKEFLSKNFSMTALFKLFKEYGAFIKDKNKEINDFFKDSQPS